MGAVPVFLAITESRVGSLIGYRGQRILLRFMGLILAAVGAEVLLSGIHTFKPVT